MGVAAVHRVRARSERLAFLAPVRRVACSLTVSHIGGDGKDGCRREAVPVGVVSSDSRHKLVDDILRDVVNAVVVVAVFREVAGRLKVYDDAVLADYFDFRVLDRGQGVSHDGQTCNARCEVALHIPVVQSHLSPLIAVLVVHVVDDVQRVHIDVSLPLHHVHEFIHHVVVLKDVAAHRTVLGSDLLLCHFVNTAV